MLVLRFILAFLTLSVPAFAQEAAKPEMVLMPRSLIESAESWISAPDPTNAVRLFAALQACMIDNPSNGVNTRSGADRCPAVTEALAEREKEILDAKKGTAK